MRQSNGCRNVRNGEMHALASVSLASCNTPATPIDSICPKNQPKRNKTSWKKFKSLKQIVLHCLGLRTHNPGQRELDLKLNPK